MALALAERGHDIAIHYNGSAAEAEATAAEARALGVRAQAFRADLLDEDQTQGLIPSVVQALGPLTVLVNNASIFEHDTLETATRDSWDRHIGSNLRAPFVLTQAFAAQLPPPPARDGEPVAHGLVVNMIDQRVLKPTPAFMTYSLAKAGLWWLTRTSAQALAPHVRVTILQRGADAGDIARALLYLLDAKAVTGQLICVDGGQHLGWQTPDILGS